MEPTQVPAAKLTLAHEVNAELTRLGAGAVACALCFGLPIFLFGARAHLAQRMWPLISLPASVAAVAGWAAVLVLGRRVVAAHLRYEGQAFAYTGSLAAMVRLRPDASLLHVALFLLSVALQAGSGLGSHLGPLLRPLLGPFGEYLGLRHRLRHTRYAGHAFDLVGPLGPYLRLGLLQWLLGGLTLGFLWGDYAVRKRRYLFAQLRWAGHAGRYDGNEVEARWLYVRGLVLCLITLGLYVPWHLVALRNYHLSRISLAGVRLVCAQDGRSYLRVSGVVWLSTVLSLGLASGWARARYLHYQIDHLTTLGELQAPLRDAPEPALDDGAGPSDLLSGALTFEA